MRAVAQRVREARVTVSGEEVASMGAGLLALVGVEKGDAPADALELARKLVHLRVFADAEGRMNLSLLDTGGSLGVVSQFTLLGDARQGRRPSFVEAAPAPEAEALIEQLAEAARDAGCATCREEADLEGQKALHGRAPSRCLIAAVRATRCRACLG